MLVQQRCSRPDWCIIDTWPTLVKVYGSMYVSKAMNILLKVLRVKNLDGLFDPASEVSGVIPNLYWKITMSKVSPEYCLSLCPYPLLVHTFLPPPKNYYWQDVYLSPYTLLWCTHFCQKKHHFGGFHSLHHTPYWCTHSWQNNHHFSSLGSSHEGVLQMALAIHLLHFSNQFKM